MASSRALLLIFALAFLSKLYAHNGLECNHDDIEQNPGLLDIEEDTSAFQEGRSLASLTNFRMYAYFDFLKKSAPASFASYVQNELLPPIIDYFQSALKVKSGVIGNLKVGSSVGSICGKSTPSILKTTGVPADFFIYYDSEAVSGTQIASSQYCYLASGTKRPLIARTIINRNMMPIANGDVLIHEQNMYVLMHEVMHTLGFSTYQYPNFIDANGNRLSGHIKSVKLAGVTRTILNIPVLTDKLRKFYGCSTLPGAIMENGGGSGTGSSHFERKYFVYETMSSGSILGRRVSEFSLGLLEASGWYVPDYSFAEPTTMVKVKAAHSSTTFAAAPLLNSMNTAPEVLEDALPMVEEVENAAVTPLWTDADSSILMKIMTVITTMDKTMQDYLTSKHMEEELAASASLVT